MNLTLFRMRHSHRYAGTRTWLRYGVIFIICVGAIWFAWAIVNLYNHDQQMTDVVSDLRTQQRTVAETITTIRKDKQTWRILCAE